MIEVIVLWVIGYLLTIRLFVGCFGKQFLQEYLIVVLLMIMWPIGLPIAFFFWLIEILPPE